MITKGRSGSGFSQGAKPREGVCVYIKEIFKVGFKQQTALFSSAKRTVGGWGGGGVSATLLALVRLMQAVFLIRGS